MKLLRRIAFHQALCMGLAARLPVLKPQFPAALKEPRCHDAGQRIVRV